MNPHLKKLIDIAISQVGTREEGGNNNGAKIREYQQATWLTPAAWSWCAAFMAWCMREWLKDPEVLKSLKLKDDESFAWRCRDASAFGWAKWGIAKHLYITDEKEPAKAGDIVVFDFSHIGLVVEDQLPGKDYIETVEGNTNGKGDRDSVLGDGVWRKQRKVNLVKNYIRIL